jgi:hypothetical protein
MAKQSDTARKHPAPGRSEHEANVDPTGRREDHHNAVPGVAIPGGSGTDPAKRIGSQQPDRQED